MKRASTAVVTSALAVFAGCGNGTGGDRSPSASTPPPAVTTQAPAAVPVEPLPAAQPFEPDSAERFPNAKRVAGRAAQRALTYEPGQTAAAIATELGGDPGSVRETANAILPAIQPQAQSVADVLYAQVSGATATSFGAMVVVRQTLQDPEGRRRSVTRTLDVRLIRSDGPWQLARVASAGGREVPPPPTLPRAARRFLDNTNITVPDSARWDVFRGAIDPRLLSVLNDIARDHRIAITVLDSGHPENVWATETRSAHAGGLAADIYAVGGRLVLRQRTTHSPAYLLARDLVEQGARQVGSPWDFDAGGRASFTDAVHQDHIHLQQRAPSAPPATSSSG